jgi:ParB family transcriptional regulator, chromosome partitioning protein
MEIEIADIKVGKRLRQFREDVADQLMHSIREIGLLHPIVVCTRSVHNPKGGADLFVFELVAGLHRLCAYQRLGHEKIEAKVIRPHDRASRLGQIDENLCGAQLTQLERSEHMLERKRIYEELHPEITRGGDRRSGESKRTVCPFESFAKETAKKAKMTPRSVRRAVKRAAKIDWRLRKRIHQLPAIADSGVELDALSTLERADQRRALALVEAGDANDIRGAMQLMRNDEPAQAQSNRQAPASPDRQTPILGTASSFERRLKAFAELFTVAAADQQVMALCSLWDCLDEVTQRRVETRIGRRISLAS